MKTQLIHQLTANFEDLSHQTNDGVEFWLARDLQHLLGYDKWDNFKNIISKAKTACEISGQQISNHFADVGKTIKMPNSQFTIHN
jgi:DNA-damage-inducible protein D